MSLTNPLTQSHITQYSIVLCNPLVVVLLAADTEVEQWRDEGHDTRARGHPETPAVHGVEGTLGHQHARRVVPVGLNPEQDHRDGQQQDWNMYSHI